MVKKKNIRSITGMVTFNGQGSINNDSNDQKHILRDLELLKGKNTVYENSTFHKKEFYNNGDGYSFRYKVSHDCIRHAMFIEEMPYYNAGIMLLPQVLYNSIATPEMIARGYMYANKEKTIKKTSVFTITDALSTDELKSVSMEVCSRSGDRGEKTQTTTTDDEGNSVTEKNGATSFFYRENVGKHTYVANFGINVDELQFISIDDLYGRCGADMSKSENRAIYLSALKRNFGISDDIEIKPYYLKTSIMGEECAEEGILLTPEMVNKVIHTILEKIIKVKVSRPSLGGLFVFNGMEITINYDDGSSDTIEVKSISDIEDLFFSYEQVYFEADEDMIAKRDAQIEKIKKESDEKAAAEKAAKKANKKAKKDNE